MKSSNKKRVQQLEQTKSISSGSSVVIYDPASKTKIPSSKDQVTIYLPHNGRMPFVRSKG